MNSRRFMGFPIQAQGAHPSTSLNERVVQHGKIGRSFSGMGPTGDICAGVTSFRCYAVGAAALRLAGGRKAVGNQFSRKVLRTLDRLGCFSLRSALASIWRMRSRVTENVLPTSSSV